MRRLLLLFALVALTGGSALAAVPIFSFNETTLELRIDTQGLTLESWIIEGPNAMAGLNDPPFNTLKTNTIPSVGTFVVYDWETQYFSGSMQTFDNASGLITDGSNPEYTSPSFLYAVYPAGTTCSDFSAFGVSYFATEGDFALPISVCIPEPATLSLLAMGGLALLRRRK